jgi:hypothetical protein
MPIDSITIRSLRASVTCAPSQHRTHLLHVLAMCDDGGAEQLHDVGPVRATLPHARTYCDHAHANARHTPVHTSNADTNAADALVHDRPHSVRPN